VRSNTSCRPTDARAYFSGAESNSPDGSSGGGVCGLFYDWLVFENSSVLGAAQVYRGKHRITCDSGAALLLNNFVIM